MIRIARRAAAIQPTLIRQITDRARPTSLHLGLGQPDLEVHPAVRAAVETAVASGRAPYTPNLGRTTTREAIARHYGCDASQVMVTVGVQEALAVSLLGTVEPGDEVLVPNPGFPAYPNLIRAAGGVPIPYPLTPGTWEIDADAIEPLLSERSRAIVLNSPSNPTGGVHSPAALRRVLELCAAREIVWISDEIYEDFVYDGTHTSPAQMKIGAGIRLGGLSKSHAMMGWRLGWLLADSETIEALKPLHQHLVTCAPLPAQVAAEAALACHKEVVDAARDVFSSRRDALLDALRGIPGLKATTAEGAFYLFVDVREHAERAGGSLAIALALLDQEDIVTIPGSGFGGGGEGYLRLAYTVDSATLVEAASRMASFFARQSGEDG